MNLLTPVHLPQVQATSDVRCVRLLQSADPAYMSREERWQGGELWGSKGGEMMLNICLSMVKLMLVNDCWCWLMMVKWWLMMMVGDVNESPTTVSDNPWNVGNRETNPSWNMESFLILVGYQSYQRIMMPVHCEHNTNKNSTVANNSWNSGFFGGGPSNPGFFSCIVASNPWTLGSKIEGTPVISPSTRAHGTRESVSLDAELLQVSLEAMDSEGGTWKVLAEWPGCRLRLSMVCWVCGLWLLGS